MSNGNKKLLRYDLEFQKSTVELIKSSGKSLSQVSREIGVSVSTLSKWLKIHAEQGKETTPSQDELTQLRAENKALKKTQASLAEEIAILKKASAYFARQMQ
jgi:transposase